MVGEDKLVTNFEEFLVSEVEQILHLCFREESWDKKLVDVFSPVGVVGEGWLSRLTGPPTLDNVPELLSVKC